MGFKIIQKDSWKRKEYFEHFFTDVPCTYSMTLQLDITGLKNSGDKIYPAMLYNLAKVISRHEEFRTGFDESGRLGVFDIMHPGHLHFLKHAREMGDELVVVVARDSTVEGLKRHPIVSERTRREMVEALQVVDGAYLGYESDRYRIVEELRPDIIALGYDQKDHEDELKEFLHGRGIEVEIVRIDKRSGDVEGTTELLKRIKEVGGH